MNDQPFIHRRSGFSLIELLVVIAVLTALIFLTFSATKAVRRQSDNTTCVQRMRAVGAALFTFAADNQGRLLPRSIGLYREPGEPTVPTQHRAWPNRLIRDNYAASPDIFFCPSFFPRRNDAQTILDQLPSKGRARTYGLRVWTLPTAVGFWSNKEREELKPLAAIENPADFFILTDSIWIHPSYMSQGYGISPGMGAEQLVHLRHSGKANALFADGHIEAKPASYFQELHLPDRQPAYSGNTALPFGVTDKMDWPDPQ